MPNNEKETYFSALTSNNANQEAENNTELFDAELTVTTKVFKDRVRAILNNYKTWLQNEYTKPSPNICYSAELAAECETILSTNKRLKRLRKELEEFIFQKLVPKRGFWEKWYMRLNIQCNEPYDLCYHLDILMKNDEYKYTTIIKDQEIKEERKRFLKSGLSFTQIEYNEMRNRLQRNFQSKVTEFNLKINRLEEEKAKLKEEYRHMKERAERAESNNSMLTTQMTTAKEEIASLKRQIEYLKGSQHRNTSYNPDRKFTPTNISASSHSSSKMPGVG